MINFKCLKAVSEREIAMVLLEDLQSSEALGNGLATKIFDSDT